MIIRWRLCRLIKYYMLGYLDTQTYSDRFALIYSKATQVELSHLSEEESKLFEELYNIAKKVSCFLEDLQRYPGKYSTECDVRKKTIEVCKKLHINYR